jgi:hypothetical protein
MARRRAADVGIHYCLSCKVQWDCAAPRQPCGLPAAVQTCQHCP